MSFAKKSNPSVRPLGDQAQAKLLRAPRAASLWALCCSLLLLSCAEASSTQVVVLMDTDYEVPAEVDRIRARVSKLVDTDSGSTEVSTWLKDFWLTDSDSDEPGTYRLPASFGIVPEDADLGREIIIELEAFAGDGSEALVARRARTGFVPGESRLLRLLLYRACAEVSCDPGQSCGCPNAAGCTTPSCVDETVRPETMEPIDRPGVLPPNAGMPKDDSEEPGPDEPNEPVINCGAPLLICGTDCVNPKTDPRYCGDCETACPSGNVCEKGSCIDPGDCRINGLSCTGFSYCEESSGQCLPGCAESEQCSGANEVCDTVTHDCACEPGLAHCDGGCVDTENDPAFCGDCETACPSGHLCEAGSCVDPLDCRTNGVGCKGFRYCDGSSGRCLPGCTGSSQCSGTNEVCDTATHDCVCSSGFERCAGACVNSQSVECLPFDSPTECGQMGPNQGLRQPQSLYSCDGRFRLSIQDDGKLVLDKTGQVLWSSPASVTAAAAAVMQADGNFVLYDASSMPLWYSDTAGSAGAVIRLQDDGNLVIYAKDDSVLWSTDTWER